MELYSQKFLNTEEFSWGYLVGRSLGIKPGNILIAAENGARVLTVIEQSERVLKATGGMLPEKIFIFYTGNDLCAENPDLATTPEDYGAGVMDGLTYLQRNGVVPAAGTDVYVVGFMSILQLATEPALLGKELTAFGARTTCGKLRESGFHPPETTGGEGAAGDLERVLALVMPPNPATMCPTLFPRGVEAKDTLSALANRIRGYRKAAKAAVELQARQAQQLSRESSGLRYHYIDGTEAIAFSADEISGDCFHLSVNGQARIADLVLAAISKAGI
jgi:lysophospholipase L1-like esterase